MYYLNYIYDVKYNIAQQKCGDPKKLRQLARSLIHTRTSNEFKTMFDSKIKLQKISLHIGSPAQNANQLLIEFINRLLSKITVTDSYNYQLLRCYIPEISGRNCLLLSM